MKSVMESIEEKLKTKKIFTCMEYNNISAWRVLSGMYDKGHRSYEFNGVRYDIEYSPTHPTIGNRSSTPEFEVRKQTAETIFNADDVLAKNEINIAHFHGGQPNGFEEPIPLESVDDILNIVKHFYEKTNLNIMIHRQSTGDVTIWLDDKRFSQR